MAKQTNELSDMMKHYFSVKERYPDCIIFYRLGDFYEMFFEDALEASRILDVTLTGRDCGLEKRAPMCGVPYHAADGYIAKLISAGKKVAICEQLTQPTKGKTLVQRDVIRVVSPGTITQEEYLDSSKNNYIASVVKTEEDIAMAWADITTGEFFVEEFLGEQALESVLGKLILLSVAEIICNEEMLLACKGNRQIKNGTLPPFSCYSPWAFNVKQAEKNLLEQFKCVSLSVYGLVGRDCMIASSGALIEYLRETQKHALVNIHSIQAVDRNEFLILDHIAVRNLELVKNNYENKKYGSLLWVLDKTQTGMGARLMGKLLLSPLKDIDKIAYRQDGVEQLLNASIIRMAIEETLATVKDIERLAGKISNKNFNPKHCLELASSLSALPSLKFQLSGFSCGILQQINEGLVDVSNITELLFSAIEEDPPALLKDGGYIKAGFNSELDELRNIQQINQKTIKEIEIREREKTGIKTLKTGFNRVFGYYIEVSNSFKDKVPSEYIRKQTLTNGERYITEELKFLEEKVLTSHERSFQIEEEIYKKLVYILTELIVVLQNIAKSIAFLDCLVAFASIAKERKYVRPTLLPAGQPLKIVDGRHPVVEAVSKERFVANDTLLDNGENRCAIITGPNMAGKSTYMRQVALIVLMAHVGCFVPAKSAEIPLTDRIFTRVGASDNLILDQSTFMVEMTEVATILRSASKNSLLVLDEVGRGTSTYDGLSIAWAVIEYLVQNIQAKTLFSTHYHELTELESVLEGVKNYKITVKELNGSILFLRKIIRGSANRSFGIEVASLAGVPTQATARAKSILKALEQQDLLSGKKKITDLEFMEEAKKQLTEVERILAQTDINTLSPMQALMLISDLKEKVQTGD